MEQRHLTQEQPSTLGEALDNRLQQPGLISEEEETLTPLAESTTTEDATPLTTLLQQEARSRREEELAVWVWSAGLLTAVLWIASRTSVDWPSLQANLATCLGLIVLIGGSICVQLGSRSYRRKRTLSHALSQLHDMSQIGPIIQSLRVQNTPVRNLAKRTLIDLLPTMQASDAPLLGDAERKILVRQLDISPNDYGYRDLTELRSRSAYRREIDLRVSILKALEQVGGVNELGTVERLSRGMSTLQSAFKIPDEIREAAKECLPFLQNRANEQRAGAELLRASSANSTSGDALLRPATVQAEALPDQLLRANTSDS